MGVEDGKLVSGADRRLSFPLARGTVIRMPRMGVYLSTNRQFVLDHYSELADEEVLLTLEFDPTQLLTGNLTDREPDFSVREATIVDYELLRHDNPLAIKRRLLAY